MSGRRGEIPATGPAREARDDELRVALINAQHDLRGAGFHVLVVVSGDDPVGCDEVVDFLHEWMDARYLDTRAFGSLEGEEAEHPRFWRYWTRLPRHGRIGVLLGGYAQNAVADRVAGGIGGKELGRRVEDIRAFERPLLDDGAVLVKFWIHLSDDEYRRRRKAAKKALKDEWHVDEPDWDVFQDREKAAKRVREVLEETELDGALWHRVDGDDADRRDRAVAKEVLRAVTAGLDRARAASSAPTPSSSSSAPVELPPATDPPASGAGRLAACAVTTPLDDDEYDRGLDDLQARVRRLSLRARRKGIASVLLLEGPDAAGKGGAIRRLTRALSARDYHVVPVAAPTDEERAHHYLWRFWRRLPRAGRMTIFDRSWYGRVLVERVEGFAAEHEWRRAYAEINDFERQLVERGVRVVKVWLHIDPDEQLRRFEARERTPYKKYKITAEDYRNRRRAEDYLAAAEEMFARTDTERAPWHVVSANDKRRARLFVLERMCEALEG